MRVEESIIICQATSGVDNTWEEDRNDTNVTTVKKILR